MWQLSPKTREGKHKKIEVYLGVLEGPHYSRQQIAAILRAADVAAEETRVIMASELDRLFNVPILGYERQHPSAGEERNLVVEIAEEAHIKPPSEVVAIDKEALNERLFDRLRASIIKETRRVDMKAALGGRGMPELSDKSDAYDIARYLYLAYHSSGGNNNFAKDCQRTVPKYIKEIVGESDLQYNSYYELIEAAGRFAKILHGHCVHGGSERQNFGDKIILKTLGRKSKKRGGGGNYKNIEVLKPLLELFKGREFVAVYPAHAKEGNPATERHIMPDKLVRIPGPRLEIITKKFALLWRGIGDGTTVEKIKKSH